MHCSVIMRVILIETHCKPIIDNWQFLFEGMISVQRGVEPLCLEMKNEPKVCGKFCILNIQ